MNKRKPVAILIILALIAATTPLPAFAADNSDSELENAPEAAGRTQTATWTENSPSVAIYDDHQGDGFYSVEYNDIPAEKINVKDNIRLLMINGGFVPNPGIVVQNGRTLVPARVVSEILGATVEWNAADKTVKITNANTEIILTAGSAEATVNGSAKTLDSSAKLINSMVYVPLRFVSEQLNSTVQYIPKLNYGGSVDVETQGVRQLARDNVSVVAIEGAAHYGKEYTVEEGLAEVKKASAQTYENLLISLKEINNAFSDTQRDYDSQAVYYADFDIGRYYVYMLDGFDGYAILFNKYTGEIFSEHAGLPFVNIDEGFINISWMYQ